MKVFVFISTLLVVVRSSTIPKPYFEDQTTKFDVIRQEAENFYETLPKDVQEDAKLLVPELIQKYGYPAERHTVTTSDGYILEMHRIPYGKEGPSENRPALYLQHGVLSSSADWVVPGPGNGLAYVLADAGYDVWLPNARGTRYSRQHTNLDPDKDKEVFWDFSWHEIAVYDLPAMIDYVIAQTNQEKIFYVGHSQGTTVFYVLCSEKSEYNDKFRAMVSLAPVGYMKHLTSPLLRIMAPFQWGVEIISDLFGIYEFLPNTGFLGQVGDILCSDNSILQVLCTNSLFAVCGFNSKQMNATLLPVIMGHTPAGASTKQLFHYSQEVNSGKFRRWDYGLFGNMKQYGSISPPSYNMKKVKVPVYLYYSRNDWMSNERDVLKLYGELGNVAGKFLVLDSRFNHLDYMYGIDAPTILYNRVIGLLGRH